MVQEISGPTKSNTKQIPKLSLFGASPRGGHLSRDEKSKYIFQGSPIQSNFPDTTQTLNDSLMVGLTGPSNQNILSNQGSKTSYKKFRQTKELEEVEKWLDQQEM